MDDKNGIKLNVGDLVEVHIDKPMSNFFDIIEIIVTYPITPFFYLHLKKSHLTVTSHEVKKVADANSVETTLFLLGYYER